MPEPFYAGRNTSAKAVRAAVVRLIAFHGSPRMALDACEFFDERPADRVERGVETKRPSHAHDLAVKAALEDLCYGKVQ